MSPAPATARRALGALAAAALATAWIFAAIWLWRTSVPSDLTLPNLDPHRFFGPHDGGGTLREIHLRPQRVEPRRDAGRDAGRARGPMRPRRLDRVARGRREPPRRDRTVEGLRDAQPQVRAGLLAIADPSGSRRGRLASNAPLPQEPAGALLGRIGSTVFLIGGQSSVRMPATGRLYLSVNDDHLPDNSGEYRIVVTRGR